MSFFDFLGGGTECCDLLLTNQELNIAIFEFCWERLGKKGGSCNYAAEHLVEVGELSYFDFRKKFCFEAALVGK